MSKTTVRQLAEVIGVPVDRLMRQLDAAGINKSNPDMVITDGEKGKLLSYLRREREKKEPQGGPPKISLKRKTTSKTDHQAAQDHTNVTLLRVVLSPPEALDRFRDIAITLMEWEQGELSPALRHMLEAKAQELGVHPLDRDKLLKEMAELAKLKCFPTRITSV